MPEFRRMSNGNRDTCCLWTNTFSSLRGQIFANNGGGENTAEKVVQEKMIGTLRMTTNMV